MKFGASRVNRAWSGYRDGADVALPLVVASALGCGKVIKKKLMTVHIPIPYGFKVNKTSYY